MLFQALHFYLYSYGAKPTFNQEIVGFVATGFFGRPFLKARKHPRLEPSFGNDSAHSTSCQVRGSRDCLEDDLRWRVEFFLEWVDGKLNSQQAKYLSPLLNRQVVQELRNTLISLMIHVHFEGRPARRGRYAMTSSRRMKHLPAIFRVRKRPFAISFLIASRDTPLSRAASAGVTHSIKKSNRLTTSTYLV